MLEAYLL